MMIQRLPNQCTYSILSMKFLIADIFFLFIYRHLISAKKVRDGNFQVRKVSFSSFVVVIGVAANDFFGPTLFVDCFVCNKLGTCA